MSVVGESTADDWAGKAEIAEVLVRYACAIDQRDWDLFRTCFIVHVHAEYDGIGMWRNVEEITEAMIQSHINMGQSMHTLSNIVVSIDGDIATARSYVDAILIAGDGQSGLNPHGFYEDQLQRTPEGWRISHRRFTMVHLSVLGA